MKFIVLLTFIYCITHIYWKKYVAFSTYVKFSGKHRKTRVPHFIKKEILMQVFSCEFCEFSKSTFSYKTPQMTAFGSKTLWHECYVIFI